MTRLNRKQRKRLWSERRPLSVIVLVIGICAETATILAAQRVDDTGHILPRREQQKAVQFAQSVPAPSELDERNIAPPPGRRAAPPPKPVAEEPDDGTQPAEPTAPVSEKGITKKDKEQLRKQERQLLLQNKTIQTILRQKFARGEPVDLRRQVLGEEFGDLPFSAIGQLFVRFGPSDSGQYGTGFLVAPGIVLTAGHVLYKRGVGLPSRVTFTPGCAKDKSSKARDLSQTVDKSRIRVSKRWATGDEALSGDFGVVALPDRQMFESCGVVPLRSVDDSVLKKLAEKRDPSLMVAGFPYEKAFGTQWLGRGPVRAPLGVLIPHEVDTTQGQSGAPVFAIGRDKNTGQNTPMVLALHSRPSWDGLNFNESRRIDRKLIEDVELWIGEFSLIDGAMAQKLQ